MVFIALILATLIDLGVVGFLTYVGLPFHWAVLSVVLFTLNDIRVRILK